ncbi:MAG: tRNA (N(6)-L-threonylcarbamoyladenosine(37)-C(2))-methylthiotransferase MtaB, partial [Bacteroidota bacterium]
MATPKSVAFYTLGCKLNYSETSSIARQFEGAGYFINKFEQGADVNVVNTCSVTEFADRKCRKIVRQALKLNPQSIIVVIGCYAQLKPDEIASIPGVDLVLGAKEKFNVLAFIDEISKSTSKGMIEAGNIQEVNSFNSSFSFGDRTRSFLKVQDGCDYKCSFCTIPLARGKSRSASIEEIVKNAKLIAEMGTKEIVLTGVNIGDYGQGLEEDVSFLDLIKALDEVEGVERIRISSIEPNLCSDEIIDFVADSKRFVPHFHMPLQSGNNKQLKMMRRRYKKELYQERVAKIKERMPHCCIGVDVIVGFPGESHDDFLQTVEFIKSLHVTYLHVFPYSERD